MPNATDNIIDMARREMEGGRSASYTESLLNLYRRGLIDSNEHFRYAEMPDPLVIYSTPTQDPIERIGTRPDVVTQELINYYAAELRRITSNSNYDNALYQITRNGNNYNVVPVPATPATPTAQSANDPNLTIVTHHTIAYLDNIANRMDSLTEVMRTVDYDPAGDFPTTIPEVVLNLGPRIIEKPPTYPVICPLVAVQLAKIDEIEQLIAGEENFKNPMEGMDV